MDEPALSMDGKRVSVDFHKVGDSKFDVWTLDLARGVLSPFTSQSAHGVCSAWSPDGSRIAYSANPSSTNQGTAFDLYARSLDGVENTIYKSPEDKYLDDWSHDGKFLLYETSNAKTKSDIWILATTPDAKPQPFLTTEFDEAHGAFSPDGRWVAYVSNASGKPEVYVRPFPGPGSTTQISTAGGDQPEWSRDGHELFYVSTDHQLMSVAINSGTVFEPGLPHALFALKIRPNTMTGSRNQYVVSPDKQRFLVLSLLAEGARPPITVVLNWQSTLRK
jgi:Tol biopolymer transport system component